MRRDADQLATQLREARQELEAAEVEIRLKRAAATELTASLDEARQEIERLKKVVDAVRMLPPHLWFRELADALKRVEVNDE